MSEGQDFGIVTFGAAGEQDRRNTFIDHMRNCPIPDSELLLNMGLFVTPQTLSRMLFMDFLYQQVLEVQGVVCEFGCRWGQNLSLFTALRGIYEPFNRLRKIVGFDTFEGLAGVTAADGTQMHQGAYGTTKGYDDYLREHLAFQESEAPLSHLTKFEVIKGDATKTVPEYFERNPHTIISLAYFDMDIYQPTLEVLNFIKNHITRGTVIGFDELNDQSTPGETVALRDALGLDRYAVRRYRYNSRTSYLVID